MDNLTLIVPGRLDSLTGGYGYDRRIIDGLRDRGWSVDVRELDASFPRPTSAARAAASATLAAVSSGSTVIIDGLAFGAMPAEVEREAARLLLVALVHHPLARESGLDHATADALEVSERRALAAARLVVVTSEATAATLEQYGVGRDRVRVVEPGTDRAPAARGSRNGVANLLSVATLIPRKGHDTLFHALAAVPLSNWRLRCVGSLEKDPPTVARLREVLRATRIEDRVVLAGEMDPSRLAAEYDLADVFVLPTHYEGYGMAVAEAIARGLPVISTTTGAIPALVASAGIGSEASTSTSVAGEPAGILVPPDNVPELAGALAAVIGDADLRARLARGARARGERLPTWDDATAKMAEAIAHVQC